tara:strand:- start:10 stop:507 length:498 start_codon:yes stop_codon:yes gene_type:complete
MKMYDDPKADKEKLEKLREELEATSKAARQERIGTLSAQSRQSAKVEEEKRKVAAEKAKKAAQVAARQAQLAQARQNQLSNMTYRSGDDDSDSTKTYLGTTSPGSGGYSPKVYQATDETPKDPGRPSSVTSSSGTNSSSSNKNASTGGYYDFNQGGLMQKRKKKK